MTSHYYMNVSTCDILTQCANIVSEKDVRTYVRTYLRIEFIVIRNSVMKHPMQVYNRKV